MLPAESVASAVISFLGALYKTKASPAGGIRYTSPLPSDPAITVLNAGAAFLLRLPSSCSEVDFTRARQRICASSLLKKTDPSPFFSTLKICPLSPVATYIGPAGSSSMSQMYFVLGSKKTEDLYISSAVSVFETVDSDGVASSFFAFFFSGAGELGWSLYTRPSGEVAA